MKKKMHKCLNKIKKKRKAVTVAFKNKSDKRYFCKYISVMTTLRRVCHGNEYDNVNC